NPPDLPPSSRVEIRRPQRIAHSLMACETIPTLAARNVVGHEHAVADLDGVHTGTNLRDFGRDLVAEDERRLRLAVPLHDVGAADSAGPHFDENLSESDPRLR